MAADCTVVIRDYRPGDEAACRELLAEGSMATVNTAFLSALTRELTFQLMVLTAALMFIFLGVPLGHCALAVPGVVVLTYVGVWLCHSFKAAQLAHEPVHIPRVYMSSELTGFWVAELREPLLGQRPTRYRVVSSRQSGSSGHPSHGTVVGTVAVTQSHQSEGSAWICRLTVASAHRRKGIASALVDEAVRFCQERGYTSVELVISEYHDAARELFHKKNFDLKLVYHRPILGSLVAVCMYELSLKLKSSRMTADP